MNRARTILAVTGLGITRQGTRILDEVHWRVQSGEHWVILGANGSGKTSLLAAITGYLTPTDGDIAVLGKTYGKFEWQKLRLKIGLVSSSIRQMMADSEPALETVISGKYAMIDLWRKKSRSDRTAAAQLLVRVGCAHIAERPWAVLSQGERQRVLIARALMARPRLLILDEPCAGLDPAAREHFLVFLQRLGSRRDSPRLILVTHHVEEIMPAFSHVLILKSGRRLAAGTKRQTLMSKLLGEAFECRAKIKSAAGRYSMNIA
jgi:iron complex transport system ATP-binding protein